jgi:hypothetical protein
MLGSVFVLVGFLGFVPNPIVSPEGMFQTNAMHNLVNLLNGAAFLFGSVIVEERGFSLLLQEVQADFFLSNRH